MRRLLLGGLALLATDMGPVARPPLEDAVPMLVHLDGRSAVELGLLAVAPGIGAARLPPRAIAEFRKRHPELHVEAGGRVRPLLDLAHARTGVDVVRNATGLTGDGVVMGVIDLAFDIAHPTFLHADGTSRVAWLMTEDEPAGLHPELEEEFGCTDPQQAPCAIYDAADIDALLQAGAPLPDALRDAGGHGTHVASIAAGDGGLSVEPAPYGGVAPEATLVLVTQSGEGYVDLVLNGARFVFDRAEALGMPAVLNLSSGHHGGPHDGTSALASGLAGFVGEEHPGRAIVAATGNEAQGQEVVPGTEVGIHKAVELGSGSDCPLRLFGVAGVGPVEIWLNHRADTPLDVALAGPDGEIWLEPTHEDAEVEAGSVRVSFDGDLPGEGGRANARLTVNGSWPAGRDLTLTLRGSGQVDGWAWSSFSAAGPSLLFVSPSRQTTATIPASHPELIAVGATVNRTTWPALDGTPALTPLPVDAVAPYSGAGPSPGGGLKPDVLAPGHFVVAAMAGDADPRNAPSDFSWSEGCDPVLSSCAVVDGDHAALAGTSMAAPQVAGTVALLFEADPTLTQAAILDALRAGARRPPDGAPGEQRGAGLVDAAAALTALQTIPPVSTPEPARSFWHLGSPFISRDPSAPTPVVIQLRDASGPVHADASRLEVALDGATMVGDPSALTSSTLVFHVTGADAEEATISPTYDGIALGSRRSPVGPPGGICLAPPMSDGVRGCGCAAVGFTPTRRPALLAWTLLLLIARRRDRRAG